MGGGRSKVEDGVGGGNRINRIDGSRDGKVRRGRSGLWRANLRNRGVRWGGSGGVIGFGDWEKMARWRWVVRDGVGIGGWENGWRLWVVGVRSDGKIGCGR
ncbi:hypothetical protein ACH5RR_031503 [Cinchona calisaya]|uniref:Uncharacterized protein n=1 Tax=Cinchona calisaya TaxID=153742 RepID=A0ABD2YFF6_9GENT